MTKYAQTLKFLGSLIAALAVTWLVAEPSFSQAQTYVLFLLCFSVALWLTEAVPPFAVGLFILAYLAFTLGSELFTSEPQDVRIYLNTFSSPVVWLMMGGFFLASAMTKTKLDADLIRITMKVCGSKPRRILFGLMTVTMVFSMLISNTATTAMVIAALMPLLVKLGKQSPIAKGLVLGIPIAATTGGMGTIIGSPPNALAVGALVAAGQKLDFITWMYYGAAADAVPDVARLVGAREALHEIGRTALARRIGDGGHRHHPRIPGETPDGRDHPVGHARPLAHEPAS